MVIDVDDYDRAVEPAGKLSAAPAAGGKPLQEWIELQPFPGSPIAYHGIGLHCTPAASTRGKSRFTQPGSSLSSSAAEQTSRLARTRCTVP